MAKYSRGPYKKSDKPRPVTPTADALPRRQKNSPLHGVLENFVTPAPNVTAQQVNDVAKAYGEGNWQPVGRMYDNLFRDDSFREACNKAIDGFFACPLIINPATNDPNDVEFANLVRENYDYVFPEGTVRYLLKQNSVLETMIGTHEWIDGMPRLYAMHPMWLWNSPTDNSWFYMTRDEGRPRIDTHPQDASIIQNRYTATYTGLIKSEVAPGDPSWFLSSNWHRGSMDAGVVCLSKLFYAKAIGFNKWLEALKYYSAPIEKIKVPADALEDTIDQFVKDYKENREEKYVVLKQAAESAAPGGAPGWDIDPVSMAATLAPELYTDFISYIDRKYQIFFLHGNLSTEIADSGGNRAAANVHGGVEKNVITKMITGFYGAVKINTLYPWAEQFNPFNPPNCPIITRDTSVLDDKLAKVQSQKIFLENLLTIEQFKRFKVANCVQQAAQLGIQLVDSGDTSDTATQTD